MKKYPLLIKPKINNALWGGEALNEYYDHTGTASEAYILSTRDGKESYIDNGSLKGKTLKTVFEDYPYWVDERDEGNYPLQIMLADIKDYPSVQVHPSDIYAKSHNHCLGKAELWYIVEADEDSGVYVGFNKDTTVEEIKQRIDNGTILDIMNFKKVHKGDMVEINAGTIHTMTGGLKVIAIQEKCDLTYRMYDFNRNDKTRELKLEEGLRVIDTAKTDNFVVKIPLKFENDNIIQHRVFPPYCSFSKIKTKGMLVYNESSPVWLFTTESDMVLEYTRMGKLDTMVVPKMHSVVIPRDFKVKIKSPVTVIKIEL